MAEDLEQDLVKALNRYFEKTAATDIPAGIAYRDPEIQFHGQKVDVIVDNPYMGIECKSVKAADNNKLYFSQHFSDGQVESINRFLQRSGRTGWLAVELKHGRGKSREAYLLEWQRWVVNRFTDSDMPGIPLDTQRFEDMIANQTNTVFKLYRNGTDYEVPSRFVAMNMSLV